MTAAALKNKTELRCKLGQVPLTLGFSFQA